MSGSYINYGHGSSDGGKQVAELVARPTQFERDLNDMVARVEAKCNPTGGFDSTTLQDAEFLVTAGETAAFHDTLVDIKTAHDTFMSAVRSKLAKLARGV